MGNREHAADREMVADRIAPFRATSQAEFIPLGMDDVSEMLALGDIARPRPSDTGTPSLGGYVGVRRTGQLIAMGGERFRLSGFTELSGIWVRPATRGIALGADATAYLTRRSLDRGEQPFLHVFPGNTAIALYVYLGFHERARLFVLWRRQTAGHLAMGSCVTQSIFFGWKVVATSFLVGTIGFGYNGPAVFLHVLHQQHGWSVSVISSAITAHFLVSAFLVAHLPDAHRRFGTAAVTQVGLAALVVGMFCWPLATTPWFLFVAAILSGAGWAATSAAAIIAIASPWLAGAEPLPSAMR